MRSDPGSSASPTTVRAAELEGAAAGRRRARGRARRAGRPRRRGRRRRQRRGRLRRPRRSRWPPCAAGKRLALANKESLIAAGPVVQPVRAHPGRRARPGRQRALRRPPVPAGPDERDPTAGACRAHRQRAARSGAGPRTSWPTVTVDEALAHPTWSMGPKITVDSSTLMNKGLEVIEAHELFERRLRPTIEVVVHPQSIVHSMVEFTDGATIAQLSHARHAPAHRLRPGLARPPRHAPFGRIDWADAVPPRLRAARPRDLPAASAWPTTPAAPAAPPRPGSTRPTRWPSTRSSTGASRWIDIARARRRRDSQRWDGSAAESLDAVIDADRRRGVADRRRCCSTPRRRPGPAR